MWQLRRAKPERSPSEAPRSEAHWWVSLAVDVAIMSASAVTLTHNVFRRDELDTVAGLTRRIFSTEEGVQGRSRSGGGVAPHWRLKKTQKKANHWIDRNSNVWRFKMLRIGWWLVWPGASLFAKRLFRGGPTQNKTKSSSLRLAHLQW